MYRNLARSKARRQMVAEMAKDDSTDFIQRCSMTRINCIPPEELCDKHLTAEHYELPRIFTEVRKLLIKGKDPAKIEAPAEYTLGAGHMKFFYTRLGYLRDRQSDLALEMARRRMKVNMENIRGLTTGIPEHLMGGWEPTEAAMALNRERIADRRAEMEAREAEKRRKREVKQRDENIIA